MAEGKVKDEKVEAEETRIEESKGKEEDTGRSEGEAIGNMVKFFQLADSCYR